MKKIKNDLQETEAQTSKNLNFPLYQASFVNKSGRNLVICYSKKSDPQEVSYIIIGNGEGRSVKLQEGKYFIAFVSADGVQYGNNYQSGELWDNKIVRKAYNAKLRICLDGEEYCVKDPLELEIVANDVQGIVIYRANSHYHTDYLEYNFFNSSNIYFRRRLIRWATITIIVGTILALGICSFIFMFIEGWKTIL